MLLFKKEGLAYTNKSDWHIKTNQIDIDKQIQKQAKGQANMLEDKTTGKKTANEGQKQTEQT